MADQNEEQRLRASQLGDRTVIGAAPIAGGGTMASTGAFDTVGGGDLGGPGARDQGDATSELRDPVDDGGTGGLNAQQDALQAQARAQGSAEAPDAEGLQDETRAQADVGSANSNDSL